MALDKMFDIAHTAKRERKGGKENSKPWRKIHYVSFTEVVDQRGADAAKDNVQDQWPNVKAAFGDVDDIRQALITLADDNMTVKLPNGKYLMLLSHEDFSELVSKAK